MLDVLKSEGYDVLGVGKIEDIFNHRGLTQSNHAAGNEACTDAIIRVYAEGELEGSAVCEPRRYRSCFTAIATT